MRFDLRQLMLAVIGASAVACLIQRQNALVFLLPLPLLAAFTGRQIAHASWSVGYCVFLLAATACGPLAALHSAGALAGVVASTILAFRYFMRATLQEDVRHAA